MQQKAKTILFRAGVSIARPSTPSPWVSGALLGWWGFSQQALTDAAGGWGSHFSEI